MPKNQSSRKLQIVCNQKVRKVMFAPPFHLQLDHLPPSWLKAPHCLWNFFHRYLDARKKNPADKNSIDLILSGLQLHQLHLLGRRELLLIQNTRLLQRHQNVQNGKRYVECSNMSKMHHIVQICEMAGCVFLLCSLYNTL